MVTYHKLPYDLKTKIINVSRKITKINHSLNSIRKNKNISNKKYEKYIDLEIKKKLLWLWRRDVLLKNGINDERNFRNFN